MTLRLALGAGLTGILAAALGFIALGSSGATEANGVLSLDALIAGNDQDTVGTIDTSASLTDATCGNIGGMQAIALVIGNAGQSDPGGTGGIPSNRDIGGWQAEINFDPAVLNITGHTFTTGTAGAGYFMEKASDRDDDIGQNNHIGVFSSGGPGIVIVGSSILGTPPGAEGVGRISQLVMGCVAAGPQSTCVSIDYTGFDAVPLGNTFFVGNTTQQTTGNHNFIPGNQHVALGINGGAIPTCPPATPTPSPTPSPTPGPNAFGNVDCTGGISSIDALKVLRFSAGLSVSQTEPCTDIGAVLPNGELQGDVDCSNVVNSIDALKLLRYAAGLSVSQTEPCPDIGTAP